MSLYEGQVRKGRGVGEGTVSQLQIVPSYVVLLSHWGWEGGELWLVKHNVACRLTVLATRLVLILM